MFCAQGPAGSKEIVEREQEIGYQNQHTGSGCAAKGAQFDGQIGPSVMSKLEAVRNVASFEDLTDSARFTFTRKNLIFGRRRSRRFRLGIC